MFKHQDVPFVPIERETIEGVRYYKVFGTEELVKMPLVGGIETSLKSGEQRLVNKKPTTLHARPHIVELMLTL
jgi:hypothetical protein